MNTNTIVTARSQHTKIYPSQFGNFTVHYYYGETGLELSFEGNEIFNSSYGVIGYVEPEVGYRNDPQPLYRGYCILNFKLGGCRPDSQNGFESLEAGLDWLLRTSEKHLGKIKH